MSSANEKKTSRLYTIREYGIDFENFIIYLNGVEENPPDDFLDPGIDYRISNRFIKNLDVLSGIDDQKPIIVSMKINGGIWEEGTAIYDAMLITPNPITIINYAFAESMSSIIFQAANKRIMLPHSIFMFHSGDLQIAGTTKQAFSEIELQKILDKQMLQIYVDSLKNSAGQASKWSKKKIREWIIDKMNTKGNVYLTAKEAVKIGFADEIFSGWSDVTKYTEEQLNRK